MTFQIHLFPAGFFDAFPAVNVLQIDWRVGELEFVEYLIHDKKNGYQHKLSYKNLPNPFYFLKSTFQI